MTNSTDLPALERASLARIHATREALTSQLDTARALVEAACRHAATGA